MQAVDDRESRLRTAFERLEEQDGRIQRDNIIRMVTVSILLQVLLFSLKDSFIKTKGSMQLTQAEALDLCSR